LIRIYYLTVIHIYFEESLKQVTNYGSAG